LKSGRNLLSRTAQDEPAGGGKQIAEKATGWRRPEDPTSLLRERKPHTYSSRTTAS
jgi:hypothetical protein